jgi:hypothetical protein
MSVFLKAEKRVKILSERDNDIVSVSLHNYCIFFFKLMCNRYIYPFDVVGKNIKYNVCE